MRNLIEWLLEQREPRVREIRAASLVSPARPFVPELHGTKPFRLAAWCAYEITVNDRFMHEVTDYIRRDGLLYFTATIPSGAWLSIRRV